MNTIYLTRSFPTLGPSNWRINKDWILCSEGKLQSPINISAESLLFDPGLKNIIVTGNKVANQTEIPHSSVFFIKVLFFFSQIKVLLKQIIQHVGSFSVYIYIIDLIGNKDNSVDWMTVSFLGWSDSCIPELNGISGICQKKKDNVSHLHDETTPAKFWPHLFIYIFS